MCSIMVVAVFYAGKVIHIWTNYSINYTEYIGLKMTNDAIFVASSLEKTVFTRGGVSVVTVLLVCTSIVLMAIKR